MPSSGTVDLYYQSKLRGRTELSSDMSLEYDNETNGGTMADVNLNLITGHRVFEVTKLLTLSKAGKDSISASVIVGHGIGSKKMRMNEIFESWHPSIKKASEIYNNMSEDEKNKYIDDFHKSLNPKTISVLQDNNPTDLAVVNVDKKALRDLFEKTIHFDISKVHDLADLHKIFKTDLIGKSSREKQSLTIGDQSLVKLGMLMLHSTKLVGPSVFEPLLDNCLAMPNLYANSKKNKSSVLASYMTALHPASAGYKKYAHKFWEMNCND